MVKKQLKVIIVDTNDVWVGNGQIETNDENALFGNLYHSGSVENSVKLSTMLSSNMQFTKHNRSEFIVENHKFADETIDVFENIDLNGIVAIRVFSEKSIMLNVDEYIISDDEEFGYDGFKNYPATFHENYTVKIENGVVREDNCPMIF